MACRLSQEAALVFRKGEDMEIVKEKKKVKGTRLVSAAAVDSGSESLGSRREV